MYCWTDPPSSLVEIPACLLGGREEVIALVIAPERVTLFPDDTFVVICKEQGEYILATRRVFQTLEDAACYAAAIADSRDPMVIPGRWTQLRAP